VVGAGGPPTIHAREFLQPVAFQAIQQPPQRKDPLSPNSIRQTVQVLGGQLIDRRGQPGQVVRPARMCVRFHGGTYQAPTQRQVPESRVWTTA
jgi:hypothetical protein